MTKLQKKKKNLVMRMDNTNLDILDCYLFKPFSHDSMTLAPSPHEQSNIMSCATPSIHIGFTL